MQLIPFKFNDICLKEACWIDKKPYFTRRAIGEWLGYVRPRADVAIAKIVAKNPHIKTFSVVTRLVTTDGKEYDIEVYDPIGLQLIIMESKQPKAIAYKIAVAHLVMAYMRGEIKPCWPTHQRFHIAMEGFKDINQTKWGHKGEAWRKLAKEIGRSPQALYRWQKLYKTRGTICYFYKYKCHEA